MHPLQIRWGKAEFHQSDEYQTQQKHEQIIADYRTAKSQFASKYDVDKDEYDRCFDVFGILRNGAYLEQIKVDHKARKRSYQELIRNSGAVPTNGILPVVTLFQLPVPTLRMR